MRFPARRLTDAEISLLSPRCIRCGLAACVVEMQMPLTDELAAQELVTFRNDALQFYCAFHSPIAVTPEMEARAGADFFSTVIQEVYCEKRAHKKIPATCLRLQPKCLKNCGIVLKLLCGVSVTTAKNIIEAEHAKRSQSKNTDRPDGTSVSGLGPRQDQGDGGTTSE
jgi:hypothetical protein